MNITKKGLLNTKSTCSVCCEPVDRNTEVIELNPGWTPTNYMCLEHLSELYDLMSSAELSSHLNGGGDNSCDHCDTPAIGKWEVEFIEYGDTEEQYLCASHHKEWLEYDDMNVEPIIY